MFYKEILLKELLAKIFKTNVNLISEDASPDTIVEWDSLRHMSLVLAIEEEFELELSDDQVVDILSYKLIKLVLAEHGIKFI